MKAVNRFQNIRLSTLRRTRTGLVILILVVLGGLVMGSCASRSKSEATFQTIDRAVQDVQPQTLGTVALDERYGKDGVSSDRPTRRVAVVASGSSSSLRARTDDRLRNAGFVVEGGNWRRNYSGTVVTVFADEVGAGQRLPDGATPSAVPGGQEAVVLQFVLL